MSSAAASASATVPNGTPSKFYTSSVATVSPIQSKAHIKPTIIAREEIFKLKMCMTNRDLQQMRELLLKDQKTPAQLLQLHVHGEKFGMETLIKAVDDEIRAYPPKDMLLFGIQMNRSDLKMNAIRHMTSSELGRIIDEELPNDARFLFREVGAIIEVLRKPDPEVPWEFHAPFPLSDVIIRTQDGLVHARHTILAKSSPTLSRMVYMEKNQKYLNLPYDATYVKEAMFLLHNPEPPPYETTYDRDQLNFLRHFATVYRVGRILQILSTKHLAMNFEEGKTTDDVTIKRDFNAALERPSYRDDYVLYASYETLCRHMKDVQQFIKSTKEGYLLIVRMDFRDIHLVLKIIHDGGVVPANLKNLSADLLSRLHKFSKRFGAVSLGKLVENTLKIFPSPEKFCMLLSCCHMDHMMPLKISMLQNMSIPDLIETIKLNRWKNGQLPNFTQEMITIMKERLHENGVNFDAIGRPPPPAGQRGHTGEWGRGGRRRPFQRPFVSIRGTLAEMIRAKYAKPPEPSPNEGIASNRTMVAESEICKTSVDPSSSMLSGRESTFSLHSHSIADEPSLNTSTSTFGTAPSSVRDSYSS